MPDFQKFIDGETGTEYTVKDAEARKNIENLQETVNEQKEKLNSFESTKSEIVSSGLGTALLLTASNTWAQIVIKIKAIINRGAWNSNISTSGGSVTVPEGYHNGSGKVTGPTLAALVGTSVTLASAADLLTGVTAYGKNGTKYTGSMANKGAVASTINPGGSYTIPAGYHNGLGKVTANKIASNTYNWSINGFGHASENNNESINISYTATENCYALGIILVNVNQNDPNGNIKMTTTGTTVYASNNAMYYGCRLLVAYLTKGQKISISGTYNTIWGQQGNMATIIVAK